MEENKTSSTQKRDWILPASILIAALLVSVALTYNAGKKDISGNTQTAAAAPGGTVTPQKPTVGADDPQIGSANAPVTMIMYSDPSCPFCGAAEGGNQQVMAYLRSQDSSWEPSIPNIMKNYVDTGKVKIVYKYFPGHGTGEQAMKMLFCANDQGKFWDLNDIIAKNQDIVSDAAKVEDLAKSVGVDTNQLDTCLASKKYDDKLQKDFDSGKAAGVEGTPAFFINDTFVSGAVSYASMKNAIDAAIGK